MLRRVWLAGTRGEASVRPRRAGSCQWLTNQRGVTYLMLMFAIVLMGISLTIVGKQWKVAAKRDHEAELVFRGNRIKAAIEAYAADYEVMKARRPNRYPVSLEQLTQKPKRYLRRVYTDPITGEDFALIKVGGQVLGVKSTSKEKPLSLLLFQNAVSYDQVTFRAAGAKSQPCMPGVSAVNPLNPMGTTPCAQPGSSSPPQ